jgi:multidrug resistance protein, MATE family
LAVTQDKTLDLSGLIERPYRAVLKLAAPTVFAMLLQSAVNEIDIIFFKKLTGCDATFAQAALSPSLIMLWLFGGSLSAISVGTQALTGRRDAERNHSAAGAVLTNAIALSVGLGLVMTAIGFFSIRPLLGLMVKGSPPVLEVATAYSQYRFFGIISMATTISAKSFLDGIGKTYVHFIASLVMNVFNVLFCYMFIFGKFGAPALGAPGAGLGALVATWIGLGIVLGFAIKEQKKYRPFTLSKLDKALCIQILKLSAPAAIATIVMMGGFGVFVSFAGTLDARANTLAEKVCGIAGKATNLAATTDIIAIMKLTFTACLAFGTATATLVSQSLGDKKPEWATKFGWASAKIGIGIFGVVGMCEGLLFPDQIIAFITDAPDVAAAMRPCLQIMGAVTPIIAVAMILSEALFGAGSTVFVAIAQFILIFFVLIPVAYVLSIKIGVGVVGMWIAAAVYAVFASLTMAYKFHSGSWKKIEL